jgi:predicted  nucleic acid-binding Zn-ribbon protein
MRYDRLRRARAQSVVVPLSGDACGACFTAVPRNRRSQIRAGMLLEGCEACGVILYSAEP